MANIVICYYSENGESFYDSLSSKLQDMGNSVYQWNIKSYVTNDDCSWGTQYRVLPTGLEILAKIKEFSPDLIFSFNNAYPIEGVEQTDCPVCLLDADNPEYFWHKDYIKSHLDRFTFLGFKECSQAFFERQFEGKIKHYHYFPAGTFVEKQEKKVDKNISFIGGYFLFLDQLFRNVGKKEYYDLLKFYYIQLKKDYFIPFEKADELLQKKQSVETLPIELRQKIFKAVHWQIIPGQGRNKTLSVLSDLGLVIYGSQTWREAIYYDADLACCFDDKLVISLKENEDVYNSSKLAVNISHPQANQCFSWRVMDIMASNACLLTEKKDDFLQLFGSYLSDEVKNMIIYTDKYDLRTKAIRLLEDEKLRQKCVKECQNAIEQNGRWEKRFHGLEEQLGVSLFSDKKGNITVFRQVEKLYPKSFEKPPKYRRIHVIWYAIKLIMSELSLSKRHFSTKRQDKIYNKLYKYRRMK